MTPATSSWGVWRWARSLATRRAATVRSDVDIDTRFRKGADGAGNAAVRTGRSTTTRVNTPWAAYRHKKRNTHLRHNGIAEWLQASAIESAAVGPSLLWQRLDVTCIFPAGAMHRSASLRQAQCLDGSAARGTARRKAVFPSTRSPRLAGRQTEVTDALLGGGLPGHRDHRGDPGFWRHCLDGGRHCPSAVLHLPRHFRHRLDHGPGAPAPAARVAIYHGTRTGRCRGPFCVRAPGTLAMATARSLPPPVCGAWISDLADLSSAPKPSVLGRQGTRQLAQCFLMPLVGNLRKVACQLQAHALARADRPAALIVEAFEEVAHGNAEYASNLEQPAGGNPVDTALVFVRLLIGHADEIRELLLGQTQHDPTFANPSTDMAVDVLCSARCSLHFGRTHGVGSEAEEGESGRRRAADKPLGQSAIV